jgi:DivIVA domain-containing protein
MYHVIGWMLIVVAAGYALGSLSKLAAARLRGVRLTAVPASVWSWLFLSPVLFSGGSGLLGHDGPNWLRGPVGLLCVASLAFLVMPGIVSRRKAGLPWWGFWTAVPAAAADSAGPGYPEGSPEASSGPVVVPDAAALNERIRTARFSTTRLQPGYDEQEVDKFLDKLVADLGKGARLDRAAVRDVTFSTTRLRPGYTEQEVDDFLDEVTAQAAG